MQSWAYAWFFIPWPSSLHPSMLCRKLGILLSSTLHEWLVHTPSPFFLPIQMWSVAAVHVFNLTLLVILPSVIHTSHWIAAYSLARHCCASLTVGMLVFSTSKRILVVACILLQAQVPECILCPCLHFVHLVSPPILSIWYGYTLAFDGFACCILQQLICFS